MERLGWPGVGDSAVKTRHARTIRRGILAGWHLIATVEELRFEAAIGAITHEQGAHTAYVVDRLLFAQLPDLARRAYVHTIANEAITLIRDAVEHMPDTELK